MMPHENTPVDVKDNFPNYQAPTNSVIIAPVRRDYQLRALQNFQDSESGREQAFVHPKTDKHLSKRPERNRIG